MNGPYTVKDECGQGNQNYVFRYTILRYGEPLYFTNIGGVDDHVNPLSFSDSDPAEDLAAALNHGHAIRSMK